eukprot:gene12271-5855_t
MEKKVEFSFHVIDGDLEDIDDEDVEYMNRLEKDEKKRKEIIPKTPLSSLSPTVDVWSPNSLSPCSSATDSPKISYIDSLSEMAANNSFKTLNKSLNLRKHFKVQPNPKLKRRIKTLEKSLNIKTVGASPVLKNLDKKKKKPTSIVEWRDEVKKQYLYSELPYLPEYRPWIEPKLINPNFIYEFDEYEDKIGEGGTASVFKAYHKDKKKIHAVKIIQWYGDEKCLADIMIEVDCLKNFHHENMVNFYDFYCLYKDQNTCEFWICMEFLDSYECLTKYVSKNFPLKDSEIASIVHQMLVTLQHLHSNFIIYRDVKSDNILINTKTKKIKLIDFGFNANIKKNKKRTSTVGTCYWMAPEVINGEYSKEIDIWSLGITIFEMMTGKPPLTNLNPTEVGLWIGSHQPPKIPKEWNKDLKDLVSEMLIFDPAKRATISELLIHPFIHNLGME